MGRPRGVWSDKAWRDAVQKAVCKRVEDGDHKGKQKLEAMADMLADAGVAGEIAAIREIGDRLDGKPAQAVTIDATIHRDPNEITDAELAAVIGTGSGARTAKTAGGKGKLH